MHRHTPAATLEPSFPFIVLLRQTTPIFLCGTNCTSIGSLLHLKFCDPLLRLQPCWKAFARNRWATAVRSKLYLRSVSSAIGANPTGQERTDMALATKFERELQKLFHRRTSWLRKAIGTNRPGKPHIFNRRKVAPKLWELGELASEILVRRRARRQFRQSVDGKRQWHIKRGKGFGIDAKRTKFKQWYEKYIGNKNCVYVFWSGRKCVYVGRTLHGKGRPAGWFDRVWFQPVTRIDIYSVPRRSEVPKAECLAVHLFDPTENKNWPSINRYTKKCSICKATKEIDRELESIFRLR